VSILARPSDPIIKRLFAVSSNRCAFPGCTEPLVKSETVVGEVCHIRSAREGHSRYDQSQTEAERSGFENLILLCRKHHKIVDTEVDSYPPDLLTEMKRAHEAKPKMLFTISDEMVQRLGELLSTPPVLPAPAPPQLSAAGVYPDWTIRELFFHVRPDLIDETDKQCWEGVGREVMDHFSTGAVEGVGSPGIGHGRPRPSETDR
jgi:hypothetical protein